MKAQPIYCGDHLTLITECGCLDYLQELKTSAERLVQLTKQREQLINE
jgi:hypothetical protein